ncbi:hypothetical protein ACI3L1_15720 [Deinococcus sp. SM5_A1]|uniref:hypothetical protein n=1 Tax=Deinococcus sp. SM5_A1 TaxID=3379094 RepID=UPI00385C5AFA
MTQFSSDRQTQTISPVRPVAQVFVEAGVPGTSWILDRVFAVFTDGSQDLVMTVAADEVTPERELLDLTRPQVSAQFGEVRLPN